MVEQVGAYHEQNADANIDCEQLDLHAAFEGAAR